MGCLSRFRWVTFAIASAAGHLTNNNVISSEEIGLKCSDRTKLWLHKSAANAFTKNVVCFCCQVRLPLKGVCDIISSVY